MLNTSWFIARRLSLSSRDRKSSPAIKVAVISTALSMAIMLIAVSVVCGFRREIRDKVIGFDAHISLYPLAEEEGDETVLDYTPGLRNVITSQPWVKRADLIVTAPVLIKTDDSFKGLYMRGVERDYDFSFLQSNLTQGTQPSAKADILISESAATKLGVVAGDSVNLFISDDLKARKVKVSGVFNTRFDSYDRYFAYAPAGLVRTLTGLAPWQGTSIDIITDNTAALEEYNATLIAGINNAIEEGRVHQSLSSLTVHQKGNHYFAWLDLLDINVWVILVLMSAVALFTLVSGMLILILEKLRFIGVMRSVGATRGVVRNVFVLLAVRVALRGMLIGGVFAMSLIVLQHYTRLIPLDSEAYYIDFVPVSLEPLPLVTVPVAFVVVSWLALILPSQVAGRIRPSRTLRRRD